MSGGHLFKVPMVTIRGQYYSQRGGTLATRTTTAYTDTECWILFDHTHCHLFISKPPYTGENISPVWHSNSTPISYVGLTNSSVWHRVCCYLIRTLCHTDDRVSPTYEIATDLIRYTDELISPTYGIAIVVMSPHGWDVKSYEWDSNNPYAIRMS